MVDEVGNGGTPLLTLGGDLDEAKSLEDVFHGLQDFDLLVSFSGTVEDDGDSFTLKCRVSFVISSLIFGFDSRLTDTFDFSDGVGVFVPGSCFFSKRDSL